DLVVPAELAAGLAGIAEQMVDLGRPEIARGDFDQNLTGRPVRALLVDAAAAPDHGAARLGEGLFNKFAHPAAFARPQHVIVGLALLEHQPHALDEVASVAPVAQGVEVTEEELLLQPMLDRGDRTRDLAGDEGFTADRALVVEQDAA